ncbi:MAG: hypothetical protein RSA70_06205, partial [Clostridia bacterium]
MVLSMAQFEAFVPMRNTLAVFGNPIEHSLSPALHIEFGRQSGLDFDYIAINVTPDEFPRAMELAREKLYGFNCTMPFKKLVVPYLDEIDEASKMLASVNTVLVHNKRLIGCSTDGAGMLDALTLSGCTIPNMQVLIVGNGGAALSIAHDLALGGAHITALVRSAEKGRIFADTLKDAAGLDAFSWTLAPDLTDDYDIIINATPLGMSDGDASPVNLNDFTRVKHVSDCIYDPPITALLLEAAKKGISWENGLPMLVAQGARSQKFWFNIEFSPEELSNTILSLRASRAKTRLNAVRGKANIALTGFMGCGKTTIG